jgi:hypothetical protein
MIIRNVAAALVAMLPLALPARGEYTLRIAMTASDIPTTTGMPNNGGLQGIEWAILGDHSGGSMHVRTLRQRYSSSRRP